MRFRDDNKVLTIVGGIVALVFILVSMLVSLNAFGEVTPAVRDNIGSVIAIISPTIVALLALLRAEQVRDDIRNGKLKEQVRKAMEERAEQYLREDDRHER